VILLLVAIFGSTVPLLAAPMLLQDSQSGYDLAPELQFFEDDSASLDIRDVLARQDHLEWQQTAFGDPNFGFSRSTIWLRANVESAETGDWWLEIGYPLLDHVNLYVVRGDSVVKQVAVGDMRPFAERPMLRRNFVLPLALTAHEPVSLYLRVHSDGTVQVPLSMWKGEVYDRHDENEIFVYGMLFGTLLVMMLYNLFVFLRIYIISYLYYLLFVGVFGLFLAGITGFGFMYLWPDWVVFQQYQSAFFLSLSGIFGSLFVISFLGLKGHNSLTGNILIAVIVTQMLLLFLMALIPYHIAIQVSLGMNLVAVLVALYTGIRLWMRGEPTAKLFTSAWGTFLIAAALTALAKFGYLPRVFLTESTMPVGMVLMVVLLSLALADQISAERYQRIRAQQRIIDMQLRTEVELEEQVQQRTVELEQANLQLRYLATTDDLTHINNRRHFFELATHAINLAHRHPLPLAMIMWDIDHFKAVNDQYGHDAGDVVLKTITEVCEGIIRNTDDFGRLGGEEFAILLLQSSQNDAMTVAEKIRHRIEATEVLWDGHTIRVTASFGVCATPDNNPPDSIEEIMKRADEALYEAKRRGRNCVVAGTCEKQMNPEAPVAGSEDIKESE